MPGCLVGFVSKRGHGQAVSSLELRLDSLLRAHALVNFDFLLRLSIVHDEGVLTDGHVLIRLESLLASFRVFALRSRFHTFAESRVEIFDARAFLWPGGIFVWIVAH